MSREWPSIFHKPHVPRRYGALHTRMWGSAASAGHGFVLLFLFGFFHLSDNSYPMHNLCSMYFTTPCDNQNPALNFFTTKETRTLPRWPFTGHPAMLQSFLTCKKPQSLWKSRLR